MKKKKLEDLKTVEELEAYQLGLRDALKIFEQIYG